MHPEEFEPELMEDEELENTPTGEEKEEEESDEYEEKKKVEEGLDDEF